MNFEPIIQYLRTLESFKDFENTIVRREVPAKTLLLEEGKVSEKLLMIEKGCLRSFVYKDGRDISFQFFFENEGVASAESFFENKPSRFNIEAIEKSVIIEFPKANYLESIGKIPELKGLLYQGMQKRVFQYMDYMLSYIIDKPRERYLNLLKTRPEIVQRVPQHYIASYLGITPVSLSRIRNKISKENI